MNILGVSGLYHDSAAALLVDGAISGAVQEERFSRKKHDDRLPIGAIGWCLQNAAIPANGLDAVAFFDKPISKLTRLIDTYTQVAPRGLKSFMAAIPLWVREKGWVGRDIEKYLTSIGHVAPMKFYFPEHHQSHAASAFFPSKFDDAAIIVADGVGEWASTSLAVGNGNKIRMISQQRFPHSIGLLYSAFTYYTGFKVNSGEYKLMGLAPYGEPKYVDLIQNELIQIREDGSIWMDMSYFGFLDGMAMTNAKFDHLFGGPRRNPESELTAKEMDLAKSIQVVTEKIMLRTARYARAITGKKNLCMAGGVALNCVANGKILREGIFDNVWIQPASGDAGGALGAALYVHHQVLHGERDLSCARADFMAGSALGPGFTNQRPKGSLSLAWKPSANFDLSAKLRRRVLQLAFSDFLARAFLNDDNQNTGNNRLVPQQDWSVEIEANRKLGPWGSTKLRLTFRDVEDFVDIVPVGSGESVGNIASATARAIDWTSTIQFDPIGWKGAKLDARVLLQNSRLTDPFTGDERQYSGFTDRLIELTLRRDIPGSDWAYGTGMDYSQNQPRFRRNQTDRIYEGPVFASFFVENKDVFGLTVKAEMVNFNNARSKRDRTVYTGLRGASPIAFVEKRDRLIGPIFAFSVKGNF